MALVLGDGFFAFLEGSAYLVELERIRPLAA
jgi:hypothetical protein